MFITIRERDCRKGRVITMKRFEKITAIILCSALLVSCSQKDENENSRETTKKTSEATEETDSETTTEAATTTTDATTTTTATETTASEEPRVYTSETDSQLQLIADSFDMLNADAEDNLLIMYPMFTVTDLNHNGRLEFIISDMQGSGKFSYTRYYEVSEDYSSLVLMNVNGEAVTDEYGDVTIPRDGEGIVVYNCYTLNGEYYYEIGNYASAGWSDIYYDHYAYHFGTEVEIEVMGGCAVSVNTDIDGIVNVWMCNSLGELFANDDDYINYMDSYWSGYESQGTCEALWKDFTEEDFEENVIACYNGFDPDSDRVAAETHDYRVYFDGFFSDDCEYVIQTER